MTSHLHKRYVCIHFYERKEVISNFTLSLPFFFFLLIDSSHHISALERKSVTGVSLPDGD